MLGLNSRRRYNGQIDTKLNIEYQIQTIGNSKFPRTLAYLELIDNAWNEKMTIDEGALYIASLYYCGILKHGFEAEAKALYTRIQAISRFGLNSGVISRERWERFSATTIKAKTEVSNTNPAKSTNHPHLHKGDISEYFISFNEKLSDVINKSLLLGNPIIAAIKAEELYGSALIASAVVAGFQLNIPSESAIAYLTLAEALDFERNNTRASLMHSNEKRIRYEEHIKITSHVSYAIKSYENTDIPERFLEKLTSSLRQRSHEKEPESSDDDDKKQLMDTFAQINSDYGFDAYAFPNHHKIEHHYHRLIGQTKLSNFAKTSLIYRPVAFYYLNDAKNKRTNGTLVAKGDLEWTIDLLSQSIDLAEIYKEESAVEALAVQIDRDLVALTDFFGISRG